MVGAVIILVVLLVVIPVGTMLSGAVVAAGLGQLLKANGEAVNEGSELIALNR